MSDESKALATEEGKKWLRDMIKIGRTTVVFVKKDGTERKMICTLNESEIPQEFVPKNSGKVKSDESLAVFDVEKNAWRSFRYDSVVAVEFTV